MEGGGTGWRSLKWEEIGRTRKWSSITTQAGQEAKDKMNLEEKSCVILKKNSTPSNDNGKIQQHGESFLSTMYGSKSFPSFINLLSFVLLTAH